jgi:hypothetical protein
VGGWRESMDESEEAQWTRINSKLELPAAASSSAGLLLPQSLQQSMLLQQPVSPSLLFGTSGAGRRHRRTLTGGSTGGTGHQRHYTWYGGQMSQVGNGDVMMGQLGPENMRMAASAVQSRNRTPSGGSREDLGYFGQIHGVGRRRSVMGMTGVKKSGSQASMEGSQDG